MKKENLHTWINTICVLITTVIAIYGFNKSGFSMDTVFYFIMAMLFILSLISGVKADRKHVKELSDQKAVFTTAISEHKDFLLKQLNVLESEQNTRLESVRREIAKLEERSIEKLTFVTNKNEELKNLLDNQIKELEQHTQKIEKIESEVYRPGHSHWGKNND